MPGKVERISTVAMKTEETPREPASVSKATRISPGHGSRKKAQTRSPPKKGPPDSSKVTLDGDPERGGIPTRVPVMAAGGEDHVGEEPIASEGIIRLRKSCHCDTYNTRLSTSWAIL